MKTNIKSLLILAASVGVGCVNATDGSSSQGRDCLFASQPQSWRVLDAQHLILWGPGQKSSYLVTLFSPLHELRFAESLVFIDDDHNNMICGDGVDKIAVPDTNVPSLPSSIAAMRKVDEAELLALGEQYKVKLVSDSKAQELKRHDKKPHGD